MWDDSNSSLAPLLFPFIQAVMKCTGPSQSFVLKREDKTLGQGLNRGSVDSLPEIKTCPCSAKHSPRASNAE